MADLIYPALMSLDGFIADQDGNFDWAEPDEEVHRFVNDQERTVGTYLYGRRMYDIMIGWETDPTLAEHSEVMREFAEIWQAAEKIVYSTTLDEVSTKRTRIVREFDPDAVRELKASSDRDIAIAGPTLAEHAISAGLVDEWQMYLSPIVVGAGTPYLPAGVRVPLQLVEQRVFGNGVVYLRYRTS